MEVKEIRKILPHRYPFLMVDRIVALDEKKAVGLKNVSINEPFFQGHYPDHPILPGVLITEALAQVGAILIICADKTGGVVPYLASIDHMRFKKPVYPGDQLRLEVELRGVKRRIGRMVAKAYVGDVLVAEGEMMCSLVKEKE
ncbi:MAG: 3-hydroxyacyl-ACP dehydratase FabZ [Candidatus Eremiobacteraeota bacterium]|nr:3-hydroxyacyl-ACP dehydratase FabZ [Candidatus Eremiobacteraeota bacterium]